MSDDLRTAITKALVVGWAIDDEAHTFEASTDAVLAVLADPVRRLAILNLIGDVTEGWACSRMNDAAICPGEHQCNCENPDPQPVLVVQPRGEATDSPKGEVQ